MKVKKRGVELNIDMEYVDIVNEDDEVIGEASYADIYTQTLPHRIVHVLIFNDQGHMMLQLRSAQKSFCPLHWSTAVGGHVQKGETYEQAAARESQEEIGISVSVHFLDKQLYTDGTHKKFLGVFKARLNKSLDVKNEEVECVEFFSLNRIKKMIDQGEKFHPELLFLLKKIYFLK